MWGTLRSLAIALALGRLAISELDPAPIWATGVVPALVGLTLAALAISFESRATVRRLFLALVILGYAAWIVHDDLGWRFDAFHEHLAGWTLLEGVVVACFVETRLWRWSLAAAVPLLGWLAYYLFLGYTAAAIGERLAWVVQAIALLAMNAGLHAIREDDARH